MIFWNFLLILWIGQFLYSGSDQEQLDRLMRCEYINRSIIADKSIRQKLTYANNNKEQISLFQAQEGDISHLEKEKEDNFNKLFRKHEKKLFLLAKESFDEEQFEKIQREEDAKIARLKSLGLGNYKDLEKYRTLKVFIAEMSHMKEQEAILTSNVTTTNYYKSVLKAIADDKDKVVKRFSGMSNSQTGQELKVPSVYSRGCIMDFKSKMLENSIPIWACTVDFNLKKKQYIKIIKANIGDLNDISFSYIENIDVLLYELTKENETAQKDVSEGNAVSSLYPTTSTASAAAAAGKISMTTPPTRPTLSTIRPTTSNASAAAAAAKINMQKNDDLDQSKKNDDNDDLDQSKRCY